MLIGITLLSCLKHKEFRFLTVVLPILFLFVAYGIEYVWSNIKHGRLIVRLCFIVQVIVGIYGCTVHQRGVVDVVGWIAADPPDSVSFAMPCHSTPLHSYLHGALRVPKINVITCEPPLSNESVGYMDETDVFYTDPQAFLASRPEFLMSDLLIVFESLLLDYPEVKDELVRGNYSLVQSFFNSHFHDDRRRSGFVFVFSNGATK
jgi:phosphatidylinositol glycan class B